jgi:hypothetical protein
MSMRWCNQLNVLSEIAKFQPQAAYAAFVSGFRHRFTYHNVIDTKFLHALVDHRRLSKHERELLSLPARPGFGVPNFNSKTV